ncbi:MAG: tRNA-specific 2-thiouridylase MnmA [Chlamydiae bacterium]|nr:tRNA-specific 2-thiouridylase MnmA [Chlamydiota bacterium]
MKTVIVGMSGGVDSSVTAYLLKKEGYRVIGLFMKNWEEEGECQAAEDYADVVQVCDQIGIPYYSVNFAKEYWERVFSRCLREYELGYTPNPDILCNREIKFRLFFQKALELGGDYLATGHYCRKVQVLDGAFGLARGRDENKDQSYFLYTMKAEILERVLFPLGELKKSEVRSLAREAGLVTAAKKDSTGICFIGKRNFRTFLSRFISKEEGFFKTPEGEVVGKHEGMAYYTIGQRRGLAIGGAGEAWYVVGKDPEQNVVYVVQGEDHPALYQEKLTATEVSWVGKPPKFPLSCTAKIRYRSPDVPCKVQEGSEGNLLVTFNIPQKAVTPCQSIVFYQGDLCLGGAQIAPLPAAFF